MSRNKQGATDYGGGKGKGNQHAVPNFQTEKQMDHTDVGEEDLDKKKIEKLRRQEIEGEKHIKEGEEYLQHEKEYEKGIHHDLEEATSEYVRHYQKKPWPGSIHWSVLARNFRGHIQGAIWGWLQRG